MDASRRSNRETYLAVTFPQAVENEGHAPGPFTDRTLEFLSRPIPIDLLRGGRQYILVDAFEFNGNPLCEVIRFRFRLAPDASAWREPAVGTVDEPIVGSTESVHHFVFRSDWSFQENVSALVEFVSEQRNDFIGSVPDLTPSEADTIRRRRPWVARTMLAAGLLILLAMLITVPSSRATIAIILASMMTILGFLLGSAHQRGQDFDRRIGIDEPMSGRNGRGRDGNGDPHRNVGMIDELRANAR